jgi:formylglycine-generating enzyme required for sulfatase activity
MRKGVVWILIGLAMLVAACSKPEVYSADAIKNRGDWFEPTPFGMAFIKQGTFQLGPSDDEITEDNKMRSVSVGSFWMDDTEITNSEYRQFVQWVRDSIARKILGDTDPEFQITETAQGVPLTKPTINWKPKIDWANPDTRLALQDIFVPERERFNNLLELDSRKLIYEYYWIDFKQAARRVNSFNYQTQRYNGTVINAEGKEIPVENRRTFIMHEVVPIYPDTLCWIRDYAYSYNEPLTYKYFIHPGFQDYPVVGVSWKQARAFCNWRSRLNENFRSRMNDTPAYDFRLPTESEWELASRGGRLNTKFPWGSYYTRNKQGCFLANFKPLRGNYVADSPDRATTMKVGSFDPNDYGLYDMAGNVAEWTSSAFFESGIDLANDFNPEIDYNAKPDDPPVMKRKVFIRNSTRTFEYQDSVKSYVGFRCVRSSFKNEYQNR